MKAYNKIMHRLNTLKIKLHRRRFSVIHLAREVYAVCGAFLLENNMRTCEIKGCNNKHYAKGLCNKHWRKQYRQDNKEKIKKQKKQYCQDNKEHLAKYKKQWQQENPEYNKQYYQDHKEYFTEKVKQYQQDNKEKIANREKQYYLTHKEHFAEYFKQWTQTPAGKASMKANDHNRRTLTKGLTKAIVQCAYKDNIKKYGVLTCCLCFKPIINNDDSLEHATPLIRQGTNDYNNLGIAHKSCNSQKHTMTKEEWL